MPVAAAFKPNVPAPGGEKAETIARTGGRADAPAGDRSQGRRGEGRAHKEEGAGRGGCRELEAPAGGGVHAAARHGCHRRGSAGPQDFFHGPGGFGLVAGRDHDQPGRIEAEGVEAMAMEPAEAGHATRRGHQPDRSLGLAQGQAGGEETQRAAIVENGLRRNFMQAVQGEAAARQTHVDRADAERQHAGIGMHMVEPGQQGAQFRQLLGPLAGERKSRFRWIAISLYLLVLTNFLNRKICQLFWKMLWNRRRGDAHRHGYDPFRSD